MRQIQGKLVLLRVSGEFELPKVRVIGVQLYVCFHILGNLGAIFNSSLRANRADNVFFNDIKKRVCI